MATAEANSFPDAKQARDLVNVLREAKQNIDPRLQEMVRYGGGGGGGGRYGGWRGGRGGGRGGHGGHGGHGGGKFLQTSGVVTNLTDLNPGNTGSNAMPLGGSRRY